MVTNSTEKVYQLLEEAYTSRTNDISNSIAITKKALRLSEEINDKALIGKSLNKLALYYMVISEFEKSNVLSERAIQIFKSISTQHVGIADALYNIGSVFYKTNDFYSGLIQLLEALKIYRNADDLHGVSKVEKAVGTIYEYIGDYENAYKTYVSSFEIASKLSDRNLESNVLNNLSGLFLKNDNIELAKEKINRSIILKNQAKDTRGLGFAIYGRGKIFLKTGQYEEAKRDFFKALDIHMELNEQMGSAMCLTKLGEMYNKLQDFEKAEFVLKQSLEIAVSINSAMLKIKTYNLLYKMYKGHRNNVDALKFLELYVHEKEKITNSQTVKIIEHYDLINQMNNLENEARINKEKQKATDKINKEEQEAVRLRQEFLSIMSHEIRTPLNAITTIISILKDNIIKADKELFNSLQFASNNLINTVNDTLDFTKLDSNKSVLEVRNVNLKELCSNIINLHSNNANLKDLNLVLNSNIPPDRYYSMDQPKIGQILGNLISNAIKFTRSGGVVLNTVLIEEDDVYDTIQFSVTDSGEGISKENLDVIFDSFSQIKPVISRDQGGTGLGLAIVKKLVELHQSEIFVSSILGKGSEFYFELKLKRVLNIIKVEPIDYSKLKGKLALIADDTLINALLMKKVLKKWNVSSDLVKDGKEAVEASKIKNYDFILMDIHMPIMNGVKATKMIRNTKNKNNNTPIFAVTADVQIKERKENRTLFDAILWKPLEIEKLYLALSKISELKA
ncbi:tetratricopeptide repeat-containing hybrid sensor histidine kinase/response regulator [Winogradskyella bathintestinalis]|uniref:histidine kinase n=1 Tax=Winogradskyella bathintestinalis TaxID=3035208 RepID=A0ABT7ZTQ3_9FLAO|nr:ATP-binding protein [Winogradskyella bathintestinalis]MDN3492341.1 ATP-binding protein [Winogradskyella bathintestinalis]